MLRVLLFTRSGALLHETEIPPPPSREMPDVVAWDARLFIAPDFGNPINAYLLGHRHVVYVEALTYTLPLARVPFAAAAVPV